MKLQDVKKGEHLLHVQSDTVWTVVSGVTGRDPMRGSYTYLGIKAKPHITIRAFDIYDHITEEQINEYTKTTRKTNDRKGRERWIKFLNPDTSVGFPTVK
jgi:hypothetical protein